MKNKETLNPEQVLIEGSRELQEIMKKAGFSLPLQVPLDKPDRKEVL